MSEIKIEQNAIDPSNCISEAWQLVKEDYGLFIIMGIVVAVVPSILGMIPYAGNGLSILSAGPLLCGYYFAMLQKRRGEVVAFNSLAEGFGKLVPAVLTTLIVAVPGLIYAGIIYLLYVGKAVEPSELSVFGGTSASFIISAVIVYLITLVLHVLSFFMMPIIADRNVGVIEAFKLSVEGVTKNVGGVIVLLILQILIALLGVLALCIGIFFVIPIVYASNIIAYKKVFPDVQNNFNDMPPQPDVYGSSYGKFE